MDHSSVICSFKCSESDKSVVSKVPFEPYTGKISITWREMLLHPFQAYTKYYHTPITIYGNNTYETVVLRAFEKVSKYFKWNENQQKYEYYEG